VEKTPASTSSLQWNS